MRIALSLEMPAEATRDDILLYVVEAVQTWRGSKRPPGGYGADDPGDPMFNLDGDSVTATYVTTHENKRQIVRCSGEA